MQHAVEKLAIVDPNLELFKSNGVHQVVDHQRRLDVGGDGSRADRIEVTLHEFAVAACLWGLAAPHGRDVIPLERRPQFVDVLGDEPRQRYGQIESHRHVAVARIAKSVHLAIGLLAAFPRENLRIFQSGRVDGSKSVRAIDAAGGVAKRFARHHPLRQEVAETLERSRFNQRSIHGPLPQHAVDQMIGKSFGRGLRKFSSPGSVNMASQ